MIEHKIAKQTKPMKAVEMLQNSPVDILNACYLQCIHNQREDIACNIIDSFITKLSRSVIDESILAAVAHKENMLIAHLLVKHSELITYSTLTRAIRMAVVNRDHKLIQLFSKDRRFENISNYDNNSNPHIMMYAIDQGDVATIAMLIELPKFHIKQHHVTYAQMRHKHDIASLLDRYLKKEQEKHHEYERDLLSEVKDQCPIGPHLDIELQRRRRDRYRSINR